MGTTTGKSYINKAKGSTWQSWSAMTARCADRANKNYGGRGIRVCARWSGYEGYSNFFRDMGPRPAGMTLDRIDVNGDYEPANCRWADSALQARNTRRNINLTYQDRTKCLEDWSRETGIAWTTIYERIHTCGWTVERALTEAEKGGGNRTAHGSPRRKLKDWERAAARAAALGVDYHLLSERAMVPPYQLDGWLRRGFYRLQGMRNNHPLWTCQIARIERALDMMEAAQAAGQTNTVPAVGVTNVAA